MVGVIRLDNKVIGEEELCFIIAEADVNRNGNVELAKRLIDIAKGVGVFA